VAAGQALSTPGEWDPVAIGVGVAMVGVILLGRRWRPPVPRRPARRWAHCCSASRASSRSPGSVRCQRRAAAGAQRRAGAAAGTALGDLPRLPLPRPVIARVGFAEAATGAVPHHGHRQRSPLTPTAPAPSPRPEPHLGHQQLLVLVELDVLDNRLRDAQGGRAIKWRSARRSPLLGSWSLTTQKPRQ